MSLVHCLFRWQFLLLVEIVSIKSVEHCLNNCSAGYFVLDHIVPDLFQSRVSFVEHVSHFFLCTLNTHGPFKIEHAYLFRFGSVETFLSFDDSWIVIVICKVNHRGSLATSELTGYKKCFRCLILQEVFWRDTNHLPLTISGIKVMGKFWVDIDYCIDATRTDGSTGSSAASLLYHYPRKRHLNKQREISTTCLVGVVWEKSFLRLVWLVVCRSGKRDCLCVNSLFGQKIVKCLLKHFLTKIFYYIFFQF